MKVALISHEFPPYIFGGIGTFCYDLAHALSNRQISTTVFAGRSKTIENKKLNEYLNVIRLPCFNYPPRSFWFQIQNYNYFKKKLIEYDILHGIYPQVGAICTILKKTLDKPLIISVHGVPQYELKSFIKSHISYWTLGDFGLNILELPINDILTRIGLANSDHIITCSLSTLSEMNSIYKNIDPNKISVISNGINFKNIENFQGEEILKEENSKSIVFFGRLYYRKGPLLLIRSMSKILKYFPNVKLHIFGRGPLESKIRSLITSLKLNNNVIIRGHVSRAELLSEIKKSNVVVLPSLYEAQPISILEAMYFKKPVITFNFPFAQEVIRNKFNGILVEPYDIDELSKKICLLLSDNKLSQQIGERAYNHVKKKHNWDMLVDKYISVYKKTIQSDEK